MIFGKRINKYYLKFAPLLLLGVAALIVVDVAQLKVPELYRMVVNGLNGAPNEVNGVVRAFDMEFLLQEICLPLIVVIGLMVLCRFLWRVGFFSSSVKIEAALRDEMFDHAKDLSQQYYQVNKVGDLMSLFTNDLETIQDCFGNGIMTFVDALMLGTLSFYKMFRMNWTLALLSMIPMACLFVMALTIGKRMMDKWEERQEKFSKLSDFSQEAFMGLAVIKAFANEVREMKAFRKVSHENEKVNVQFVRYETIFDVSIEFFIASVFCIILGYGGWLVHEGTFTAGELIEFIGYFNAIIWPILAISFLVDMTARGRASLKRVSKFLGEKIDVQDSEEVKKTYADGKKAIPDFHGGIEFSHLSFTHPGSTVEVLHDVSFKIAPGESVGLIGRTGAGKSTIVDLIARTYNVPDGTIFVDGVDVNKMPIAELRRHIAYVPQDNFLFSQKIVNNIAFAFEDEAAHLAEVEEAARLSDVYDDIAEFPRQFNTVLGERGVTVSGGQKQRISIARALMKNAEILILDDSVSAVDTETERVIIENLKKKRTGMTTILIAHRISTVEKMDKILFIEDGKVVDFGTPAELSGRCPEYREMVRLQKLEDERKAEERRQNTAPEDAVSPASDNTGKEGI